MGLFSRKSDAKNYGQNVEKAFMARDWKKVEKLTVEAMEKYPDDANAVYVSAYMACDFNQVPASSVREILNKAKSLQPRDASVTEHLSLEAEFAYIVKKSKEFFVENRSTEDISNYCEDLSMRIRDSYMAVQHNRDDAIKARHIQNVGNAIRNCFTHPATWLGVALFCPFDDSFDDYDMEIALKMGMYQANETGLTMGEAMAYVAHPDPTKQLIGHAADDYIMFKNRDEMYSKMAEILRDSGALTDKKD